MRNRNFLARLIFFAAGLALFCTSSLASGKPVDEISLVVDQESMTSGEMEESIQAFYLSQRMTPPAKGSAAYEKTKKEIVEGFVREVLMAKEADRMQIEVSEGEIDHEVNREVENMKKGFPTEQDFEEEMKKEGISLDDLRQDIRAKLTRRIKANRVLRQKQQDLPGTANVSDEDARKYFEKHTGDYEKVNFAIILFRIPAGSKTAYAAEVQAQAQGVLKELQGGANFAAYAKKYSEDQGSAEKGGEVGTVYRSQLEPKLAKGIFAIPAKGMGIVKAADGVYIVKVESKGKADYASVASEIKSHLRGGKKETGLKQWLDNLKKNAYIVLDGKPISTASIREEEEEKGTATPPSDTATPGDNSAAAKDTDETPKGEVYPSLPPGGTWTLSVGGTGFSYGTQDIGNFYGATADAKQGFPFGFGIQGGIDYAFEPTIQAGLLFEVLTKVPENVSRAGNNEQWSASTLGPSLSAKLLIPLDESTNFILSGAGGYYFMNGSSIRITGPSLGEMANLGGESWGGQAGAAIEMFLDSKRDTSIALGGGYRYLQFTPVTTNVVIGTNGNPVSFGSTLMNSDGTPGIIDFTGIHVDATIRFYLGKND